MSSLKILNSSTESEGSLMQEPCETQQLIT